MAVGRIHKRLCLSSDPNFMSTAKEVSKSRGGKSTEPGPRDSLVHIQSHSDLRSKRLPTNTKVGLRKPKKLWTNRYWPENLRCRKSNDRSGSSILNIHWPDLWCRECSGQCRMSAAVRGNLCQGAKRQSHDCRGGCTQPKLEMLAHHEARMDTPPPPAQHPAPAASEGQSSMPVNPRKIAILFSLLL